MGIIHITVLLLLQGLIKINSQPCFAEEKSCEFDSSNLLEVLEDVDTISECKQLCKDNSWCQYFAYHEDELVSSHNHKCYILSSCDAHIDYPSSIIGFTGPCTCSLEVQPTDGQLLMEIFTDTEIECKDACQGNSDCKMYSYHKPTKDCEMLSSASSFETSALPEYYTGPADCTSEDGACKFALLDNNSYLLFNYYQKYITVRSGMLDCMVNISIVLVGDGGRCSNGNAKMQCYGNAGGSGYVNRTFANVEPSTEVDLVALQDSYGPIYVYAKGELIAKSITGEKGTAHKGGDGYSGGGFGIGDGGFDGGDGGDSICDACGKGQGIDIKQYSTPHFALTPGPGPKGSTDQPGGGGGVLVNGLGPPGSEGQRWSSFGEGQGNRDTPKPGCALLEIVV